MQWQLMVSYCFTRVPRSFSDSGRSDHVARTRIGAWRGCRVQCRTVTQSVVLGGNGMCAN